MYFNQKLVSPVNNAYPYRAYLESLLKNGPDAKSSHLTTSLWVNDVAGEMDQAPGSEKNQGLIKRQKYLQEGKTVDLIGHLRCDVFNQDKLLLNGVEVRLRFIRSKDTFCLMDASEVNYSVHINEATLLVRRIKVSPTVLIAHANTLASPPPAKYPITRVVTITRVTTTAKYPITRVEVKSFTIHSGIIDENLENVILGQLPKRIILGFVNNKSFNGDRALNPFNFQNFSINFLSIYVDGAQIPSKPLQPKFAGNSPQYVEAYHTLFSGTGIHYINEGNDINRSDYANGYCLFAFDLTPDLSAHFANHWNLVKHGTIRIEVGFEKALTQTINCVLYAEYDNMLEIDASRQVIAYYNS